MKKRNLMKIAVLILFLLFCLLVGCDELDIKNNNKLSNEDWNALFSQDRFTNVLIDVTTKKFSASESVETTKLSYLFTPNVIYREVTKPLSEDMSISYYDTCYYYENEKLYLATFNEDLDTWFKEETVALLSVNDIIDLETIKNDFASYTYNRTNQCYSKTSEESSILLTTVYYENGKLSKIITRSNELTTTYEFIYHMDTLEAPKNVLFSYEINDDIWNHVFNYSNFYNVTLSIEDYENSILTEKEKIYYTLNQSEKFELNVLTGDFIDKEVTLENKQGNYSEYYEYDYDFTNKKWDKKYITASEMINVYDEMDYVKIDNNKDKFYLLEDDITYCALIGDETYSLIFNNGVLYSVTKTKGNEKEVIDFYDYNTTILNFTFDELENNQ